LKNAVAKGNAINTRSVTRNTLLRQWQMLRLIPRYPAKITTRNLMERLAADSFKVSKRTVERDLMTLSDAFPLHSDEREKPFGWSWQKNAVPLDVPSLGNGEALAFQLIERYLHGLLPHSIVRELEPYLKMARQRLSELDGQAKVPTWPAKIRVVQPTQPLLPPIIKPEVQQCIGEALLNDRQLQIHYQPRGKKKSIEYTAHPLALIQRGPITYLAACLFEYQDIRLLALHRVGQAAMLNAASKRPKNFDIDKYIESGALGWGNGKIVRFEAKFLESAAEHLYETPLSRDQVIVPLKEGWVHVAATIAITPQLTWWILGFGDGLEVVKPSALRKTIRQVAIDLFKNYA
jgi:predicted DNA-binding transcriptional regulator YafY